MLIRKLAVLTATVAAVAGSAATADAKVAVRWEKVPVPFVDQGDQSQTAGRLDLRVVDEQGTPTTAKGSSAVVSLGKLGRV